MEELELKHLAGYLPYGLKLWHNQWKEILIMDCAGSNCDTLSIEDVGEYAKPILRSLSDLAKEDINSFSVDVRLALRELNFEKILSRACYYELQWLLKNHYDIHNLIENNLAIDINTLNK